MDKIMQNLLFTSEININLLLFSLALYIIYKEFFDQAALYILERKAKAVDLIFFFVFTVRITFVKIEFLSKECSNLKT